MLTLLSFGSILSIASKLAGWDTYRINTVMDVKLLQYLSFHYPA
jgi:hypothetical protein